MNEDKIYNLKKINLITNLSLSLCNKELGIFWSLGSLIETVLNHDAEFLGLLVDRSDQITVPAFNIEIEQIIFGCMKISPSEYLLAGPVCAGKYDYTMRHHFYRRHKINNKEELTIPHMKFDLFIELLILLFHLTTGSKVTYDQILKENGFDELIQTEMNQKKTMHMLKQQDENRYHHTYMEEKRWTDAIRAGDVERAGDYVNELSLTASTLSKKAINNNKYLAICAVTIGTRAAIDGGVDPSEAYAVSDILIDKVDGCSDITELNHLLKNIATEFAKMVQETQKKQIYSNYVDQCKWFINKNYQKKVYLEEMSEFIGVNGSYLSHLFSKIEGITMKDYLNQVRVERAQNLLRYSNSTLAEICDYVGLGSQSYFGRIFKKYTHMTPQHYRNCYKAKEFVI